MLCYISRLPVGTMVVVAFLYHIFGGAVVGATNHGCLHFCGNYNGLHTNPLVAMQRLVAHGLTPSVVQPYNSIGTKSVLVIRVDFSDLPGTGPSAAVITNNFSQVREFYRTNSYGNLHLDTVDVTPLLRMPGPSSSYTSLGNGGTGPLYADADASARASGMDPNDYDFRILAFTWIGFGFAGRGNVGGPVSWIQGGGFDIGVVAHELGHNLGLNHPTGWRSPSVTGEGFDNRNWYDVMGGAWGLSAGFNAENRHLLGWLPPSAVHVPASSGVFRIYAVDANEPLDPARKYALRIPASITNAGVSLTDYWVECRQISGGHESATNGVLVSWAGDGSVGAHKLLDATPGTLAGSLDGIDGALVIGQSLTDVANRITIAPIVRGGEGSNAYVDVQVTMNSTIVPPTITKQPLSRSALTGSRTTLSVEVASDVPVSYQWRKYGIPITAATNAVFEIRDTAATDSGEYFATIWSSRGALRSETALLSFSEPPVADSLPSPPGLAAWWKADGNPDDSAGNHDGMLQGSPTFEPGRIGGAFSSKVGPDGKPTPVTIPDNPLWSFGVSDFTLGLWVNFSSTGSDQAFIAHDEGPGSTLKWIFWRYRGDLGFHLRNEAGSVAFLNAGQFTPKVGQWYHLAIVRSGDAFTFMVDGLPVATVTNSLALPNANAPLTFGGAEGGFSFAGKMDDVRIHSRALSVGEIQSVYQAGTNGLSPVPLPGLIAHWPADTNAQDAVGVNHGSVGAPTFVNGKIGQALDFDGTNSFVSVPDDPLWNFGTNNFSIELWANFRSNEGSPALIASDDGGGTNEKWIWWLNDGHLRFLSGSPTLGGGGSSVPFQPATGRWYHLALTRAGDQWHTYIDGALAGVNVSDVVVPDASEPLTIGQAEGGFFLDGMLDDIRIYSRAISAGEVSLIHRAGTNGMYSYSNAAPVFFEHPSSRTVTAGGSIDLRTTVYGAAPFSYQWRKDGQAIAGATNAILSFAQVTPNDSGDFSVAVSNAGGGQISRRATLGVSSPPIPPNAVLAPSGLISWWTGNGTAADGKGTNRATLMDGVGYAPGLVDQAFVFDGIDDHALVADSPAWAFGADDFSIDLWANFSVVNEGMAFVASDEGGGNTRKWIFWLYRGRLRFHLNGPGGSANIGSAVFSPTIGQWYHLAVTRSGSSYRFFINGSVVSSDTTQLDVPDAAAPLTIGQAENAFRFNGLLDDVRIYGRALGDVEIAGIFNAGTNGMTLPVPPYITMQPNDQTVPVGANALFSVVASGSSPLSFEWQLNGTNLPGATNATLTIANVSSSHAGEYRVVITNGTGAAISLPATMNVDTTAARPAITIPPTGQTLAVGSDLFLGVSAAGASPLNYQWQKDGINLTGQTAATLALTSVDLTDSGIYQVIVSNSYGMATSAGAVISVNTTGTAITWNTPTTISYGRPLNVTELNASAGSVSGSFAYMPPPGTVLAAGSHQLSVQFTPHDTNTHSPASGSVMLNVNRAPLTIQANDQQRPLGQPNLPLTLTYSGFVNGEGTNVLNPAATTTTTAHVGSPIGTYPITVSGGSASNYVISRINGTLRVISDVPMITRQPTNQLVQVGVNAQFEVEASGAGPFGYQWNKDGTNISWGTNRVLQLTNVTVSDRGAYQVRVTNAFGSVTSEAAALLFSGPPVVIIDQPDVTVVIGATLELRVILSGTPPFNSTWYNFVTPINGATTPVLTLTNVQPAQAGIYQLTAFNSFGNAASRQIRVTVVEPLTIGFAATNYSVLRGQPIELRPTVGGSAPLHFSWFKAGLRLTGETNPLLAIPNAQRSHAGVYRAQVSNQVGVANSEDVHLRVLVPARVNQPARLTDGRFRIQLGASDDAAMTGGDLTRLVIEGSRDFTNWSTLSTNGSGLTLTNGQIRFDDAAASSLNSRFYRVFER